MLSFELNGRPLPLLGRFNMQTEALGRRRASQRHQSKRHSSFKGQSVEDMVLAVKAR